jgi:hypothetical protein
MAENPSRPTLPDELLDDERSWQGDHDPYLGSLAKAGRQQRGGPPPRAPRLDGPVDDGDPYLAELARRRRDDPD